MYVAWLSALSVNAIVSAQFFLQVMHCKVEGRYENLGEQVEYFLSDKIFAHHLELLE